MTSDIPFSFDVKVSSTSKKKTYKRADSILLFHHVDGCHRHLGLHRFLFYGAGKRCTVIVEVNLFYSDCHWCKIIVIIIVLSFRR